MSGEQVTADGTFVDVAVRQSEEYTYFEIKTGLCRAILYTRGPGAAPLILLLAGCTASCPAPFDNFSGFVERWSRAKETSGILRRNGANAPRFHLTGLKPRCLCQYSTSSFKSSGWTAVVQPHPCA